jgi:predicted transcriptional regulator
MPATQGIKLDDETQRRLKALGALRQRSPHWLMRAAIQDYLDREEKAEREKREDMERWERFQHTGHAIPHDRAAEWLKVLAAGQSEPPPP